MKNVDILICLLAIYIIKLSVGSQIKSRIKYYTELQMETRTCQIPYNFSPPFLSTPHVTQFVADRCRLPNFHIKVEGKRCSKVEKCLALLTNQNS
jgi:hypothetical protein